MILRTSTSTSTTVVVVGVECNIANCYRGTVLLLYNNEEAVIYHMLTEVLTVQVSLGHVGASIETESRFAHTSTRSNGAIFLGPSQDTLYEYEYEYCKARGTTRSKYME